METAHDRSYGKFKHLNVLRVAAADIMAAIPLMVVSDYLTYIAESIVEQTWWHVLGHVNRNSMACRPNTSNENINFAIIGFGKFGGIELGYGSDLDLGVPVRLPRR